MAAKCVAVPEDKPNSENRGLSVTELLQNINTTTNAVKKHGKQ